jgi:hypothetical protein
MGVLLLGGVGSDMVRGGSTRRLRAVCSMSLRVFAYRPAGTMLQRTSDMIMKNKSIISHTLR